MVMSKSGDGDQRISEVKDKGLNLDAWSTRAEKQVEDWRLDIVKHAMARIRQELDEVSSDYEVVHAGIDQASGLDWSASAAAANRAANYYAHPPSAAEMREWESMEAEGAAHMRDKSAREEGQPRTLREMWRD